MELPTYFSDFLSDIRLTDTQVEDLKAGHTTLRRRLEADADLAALLVATFLQGSYRRATAVRPVGEGSKADVDVIVVTTIDHTTTTPEAALDRFVPFLEKHYAGKWKKQGRSLNISMSSVSLDVVITSAPLEVDKEALRSEAVLSADTLEDVGDWRFVKSWVGTDRRGLDGSAALMARASREQEYQVHPLLIPDRDARLWRETHPLAQIHWSQLKNARCNSHYVNVVKALKWWRVQDAPGRYPKSYPLEHLIGANCPDGIDGVATGVVDTLESIRDRYSAEVGGGRAPVLMDHGVGHNVLLRITAEEFAAFHARVKDAAVIARAALGATDPGESAREWRRLFGTRFPEGPDRGRGAPAPGGPTGGFSPRSSGTTLAGGRFA